MRRGLPLRYAVPLLFTGSVTFESYVSSIQGIYAWYRMGDTGAAFTDSVGSNDLTISGTPTQGAAGIAANTGLAADFDGATSYAEVSASGFGRKGWTYIFLLETPNQVQARVLTWSNNDFILVNAGLVTFRSSDTGNNTSTTDGNFLSASTNYWLAATVNSSTGLISLSAIEVGTTTVITPTYTVQESQAGSDAATTAIRMGANLSAIGNYNGKIDEMIVINDDYDEAVFKEIARLGGAAA